MPAPSTRTAPREPGPPCRVLLVGDDRTIATDLYDQLSTRGFEVDLAHDGAVVLHQIGNQGPACLRR
jgi:DNA-binding response OmpR family regulator